MINKSLSQKGSAHIVIIIILVVALLGTLGFVFWQNFMQKDTETKPTTQSSTQKDTPKQITYKTYQTNKYPISFKYPDSWTIKNEKADDQSSFSRSVDVVTSANDVVSFSAGGQGLGGTCGGNPPTRSTVDVTSTALKTPKPTTLSYTLTANSDGSYDATYGLTDTYTEVGDQKACDNTFYYLFSSGNDTYMLMSFSGKKHFANLEDAKAFINSDEYSAIKKMILTLAY